MYDLNENYFENIDTEQKAYFLGFIFADGNIQLRQVNTNKYRLRIGLRNKYSEIALLNTFKNELMYEGDIRIETKKNGYEVCILDINSKKLITDLIKHGVNGNKTRIIKFPTTVPRCLIRHFIRGFFDGDGCIRERKSRPNGFQINITCANYYFLRNLLNIFKIDLNIDSNISTSNKTGIMMYSATKDKNAASVILDYMYYNSNIHLNRKYMLYKKFTAPLSRNI